MKSKSVIWIFAVVFLTALSAWAGAQTQYNVTTLSTLGGTSGAANSINNRGWASGVANFSGDGVGHAALWINSGNALDLGALGGPTTNSAVAWPVKNDRGIIVGISDTAEGNPLGEAFSCWAFFAPGSPNGKICKGFRWQNDTMTALQPFPGGYNSYATAANNRGQIVGWAENGVHDPSCDPAFQQLQFRAVIWQPDGTMQELPPLPGDSTSAATAINDRGQVVGISGACGIAIGSVSAAHAVLWEDGVAIDLGSFGGHAWNTPSAINNHGTVVGFSLPASKEGTRNFQAFIWTKTSGMQALPVPATDIRSEALGINDKDQIVGLSRSPSGIRAVLWQNNTFTDLNDVAQTGSPYLLFANDINDAGEISGEAFDPASGDTPAYVASPLLGSSSSARSGSANVPSAVLYKAERRASAFGTDPRQ